MGLFEADIFFDRILPISKTTTDAGRRRRHDYYAKLSEIRMYALSRFFCYGAQHSLATWNGRRNARSDDHEVCIIVVGKRMFDSMRVSEDLSGWAQK